VISRAAALLSTRLLAIASAGWAVGGSAAVSGVGCGPSPVASAPRTTADPPPSPAAKTEPLPPTTTTVLDHELPPGQGAGEACGGKVCPPNTYCDTQMSPRGPQPMCTPMIQSVPGRSFPVGPGQAPLVARAWV
jgi:hypothetical protein